MAVCGSDSLGDGRFCAACMTASICRSQLVNWFQLLLFWSTNLHFRF